MTDPVDRGRNRSETFAEFARAEGLVSTACRRAARSASKISTTSINCPWSWSPHRKIRRPALRRASRTG
jgi:hypothetical protein